MPFSDHLDIFDNKQFKIFPFYKLTSDSNVQSREKEKKHFIRILYQN